MGSYIKYTSYLLFMLKAIEKNVVEKKANVLIPNEINWISYVKGSCRLYLKE